MRRMLIGMLLLALAGFCLAFRNRDTDRVYQVGIMITDDTYLTPVEGFRQAMKELGYVEGQHIVYRIRNAKLDREALRRFAEEFVTQKVDLIFTATYVGASLAKEATATTGIPVVFGPAGDPVETGLVQSITASGNNLTGVSTLSLELTAKRLEDADQTHSQSPPRGHSVQPRGSVLPRSGEGDLSIGRKAEPRPRGVSRP